MKEVYNLHKLHNRPLGRNDGMVSLLPHASNTIVTDMMNLSDPINRFLLNKGFNILNSTKMGPWDELIKGLSITGDINVKTIGFQIGPLLNAAGRMGQAHSVYRFLTKTGLGTSAFEVDNLIYLNTERKTLQAYMAHSLIKQTTDYLKRFKHSICLLSLEGHGVGGILASQIGNKYRRPIFVLDRDSDGNYVSSGRSILPNVSMDVTIKTIIREYPGVIIRGGGHDGAGGCTITDGRLDEFMVAFDKVVCDQTGGVVLDISKLIDHTPYDLELPVTDLTIDLLNNFNELAPYGQGFPEPTIKTTGYIQSIMFVGKKKEYTIISLATGDGTNIGGFYPYNDKTTKSLNRGDLVTVICTLDYRGSRVEMSVQRIRKVST